MLSHRTGGVQAAMARFRWLFPPTTGPARRRTRLVVADGLEEYGFGVLDWRALPGQVAVELLHAAGRIARDGHSVAFTGYRYRSGPELTVDGRLTVTRYLSGQRNSNVAPPAELLVTTLTSLSELVEHVAVVCAQPELNERDATEAVTRWQRTLPSGRTHASIDVYGHDWTVHR